MHWIIYSLSQLLIHTYGSHVSSDNRRHTNDMIISRFQYMIPWGHLSPFKSRAKFIRRVYNVMLTSGESWPCRLLCQMNSGLAWHGDTLLMKQTTFAHVFHICISFTGESVWNILPNVYFITTMCIYWQVIVLDLYWLATKCSHTLHSSQVLKVSFPINFYSLFQYY